eukprot:jgi/Bigna1/141636/aug1.64_g16344
MKEYASVGIGVGEIRNNERENVYKARSACSFDITTTVKSSEFKQGGCEMRRVSVSLEISAQFETRHCQGLRIMATQNPRMKQANYLAMAVQAVKRLEREMLLALDNGSVREALHKAMEMLSELSTSKLTPQNYYDLYMHATDVLRRLEAYIIDEDGRGGVSVVDLYESVQYAGTIVPRLYLLATVGSAYIRSKKAPCKMTRDKLPDKDSEYEGDGGDMKDAIEFVLQNFGEMNKLWVRMQHQGALRDLGKREEERRNLKQLVGTALVRLVGDGRSRHEDVLRDGAAQALGGSRQLQGRDRPRVPDGVRHSSIPRRVSSLHPRDLPQIDSASEVEGKVNVNSIIVSMMNRLSNFARTNPGKIPSEINIFALFHKHSSQIIKAKALRQARPCSTDVPWVVDAGEPLDTVEKVTTFFKFIEPSLKDQKDSKTDDSAASKMKFIREQELVARVFHLVHSDDTDTQYELFLKARALVDSAHLFWPSSQGEESKSRRNDRKLLKLVQRALKAANESMKEQVELFVVILNKCLFFFEKEVPTITVKYVQGLICLIQQHLPNLDVDSPQDAQTQAYYNNTVKYIKAKKDSGDSDSPYLGLDIDSATSAS